MKLFDDNGYINIDQIIRQNKPFTFVVGGRGIGKTYSALLWLRQHKKKFILLRRTQAQVDIISKPDFCPYNAICSDTGDCIIPDPINKYVSGLYDGQADEQGIIHPVGEAFGYMCALSTISNLRGFDASTVEIILYDEFIPQRHERPIKQEGAALLNAYETVNRNRQLNGRQPVQLLCLANSNNLANPIFEQLGLINKAESMQRKQQDISIDDRRGIMLILVHRSPISTQKSGTALYKLGASNYADMALKNDFVGSVSSQIHSMPLREYNIITSIGQLNIYRHKTNGRYYCSSHLSGTPDAYGLDDISHDAWKTKYRYIFAAYLTGKVDFESYGQYSLFTKYF